MKDVNPYSESEISPRTVTASFIDSVPTKELEAQEEENLLPAENPSPISPPTETDDNGTKKAIKMAFIAFLMVLSIQVALTLLLAGKTSIDEERENTILLYKEGNDTTSNENEHDLQRNGKLPFCLFDDTEGFLYKTCPDANAYKGSCRQNATSEIPDGGLPPLHDSDTYIPRLLQFFHGRRVTLVGDSLTRQWYETLSCRLGMKPKWYAVGRQRNAPGIKHLRDAARHNNVTFKAMNTSPKNMRKKAGRLGVYGYSRASSRPQEKKYSNFSSPSCQFLNTALDYYHVNNLGETGSSTEAVFQFITNNSDVVVFNIGAHYDGELDLLDDDLQEIMELCGEYNADAKEKSEDKRCYFRETLPAHFQFESKPCGEYLVDTEKEVLPQCGPMHSKVLSPFNANVSRYGNEYGVPIVNASVLFDAWRWHVPNPGKHVDCRHFCQDNEVWDLLHESLLQTAAAYE